MLSRIGLAFGQPVTSNEHTPSVLVGRDDDQPRLGSEAETPWGTVVLWVCTASVGAVLALMGFVGVVDPVGSKHADDSDPFGAPGARTQPMYARS